MNKLLNYDVILLIAVIMVIGVAVFIGVSTYNYEKTHRCDSPYEEVCTKWHTENKMVPVPSAIAPAGIKIGKGIKMTLRPIKVCDDYALQLKEGCEDK